MGDQVDLHESSATTENYFRLNHLIVHEAPKVFRPVLTTLLSAHYGNNVSTFLATKYGKNLFKDSKRRQQKNLTSGDVTLWDLPLILDCIVSIQKQQNVQQDNKDFQKLKEIRNVLAHSPSGELSEDDFIKDFTTAKHILERFGYMVTRKIQIRMTMEAQSGTDILSRCYSLLKFGNKCFIDNKVWKAIKAYTEGIRLLNNYERRGPLWKLYEGRSIAFCTLPRQFWSYGKMDAKTLVALDSKGSTGYLRLAAIYDKLGKFTKAKINYQVAERYVILMEKSCRRVWRDGEGWVSSD
ncbi:Serine/threonine-protein phosphatase 5 [Folsomia candida]|uniref:Serine/threonine-protein phosphatase 5 n=1 Tax=Folsomia candida TaxID=158441 RepID=A0A226DC74_FOLCA|nr:Serine/threonine-protein phosphatase 5 [Folsomia candida]